MNVKFGELPQDAVVDSPLGMKGIDSAGSTVSGVRMDVNQAYAGIPRLLERVVNENDHLAWTEIKKRIDAIASHLESTGGSWVSPGIVDLSGAQATALGFSRALQIRDPDGHQLQIVCS